MRNSPHPSYRRLIMLWFILDAVVAMAPSLYWAANGQTTPIFGIPVALFYFLAVGTCVTASLVTAYVVEPGPRIRP